MTDSLLQRLAAGLVSRPLIYDLVQNLAGQARVAERLRVSLAALSPGRCLDLGSADGGFASRLDLHGVFTDIDLRPLAVLRRSGRGSAAVAADGTALPFADGAFDVSLCVAVSHHLDDSQLDRAFQELSRVTRRHLVFLDALRDDTRRLSRWLWRHDRGRYPRTLEQLRETLGRRFQVREEIPFTIYHRYVLWVASPR